MSFQKKKNNLKPLVNVVLNYFYLKMIYDICL